MFIVIHCCCRMNNDMLCYAVLKYRVQATTTITTTITTTATQKRRVTGDTIVIILFKGLIWVPYFRFFDFLVVPANNIKRTGRERGKKEKGFLFSLQTKIKKSYFEN